MGRAGGLSAAISLTTHHHHPFGQHHFLRYSCQLWIGKSDMTSATTKRLSLQICNLYRSPISGRKPFLGDGGQVCPAPRSNLTTCLTDQLNCMNDWLLTVAWLTRSLTDPCVSDFSGGGLGMRTRRPCARVVRSVSKPHFLGVFGIGQPLSDAGRCTAFVDFDLLYFLPFAA